MSNASDGGRHSPRRAPSSSGASPPNLSRPSTNDSMLRPPPMAVSMLHAKTTRGLHSSKPVVVPSRPRTQGSDLAHLARQQRAIEEHMQTLLDAQADALLAGLAAPAQSSRASSSHSNPFAEEPFIRSATPNSALSTTHAPSPRATPVRQPLPSGPRTLRSARKAIWDSMHSLASLKAAEVDSLTLEFERSTSLLAQIDNWSSKAAGLTESIAVEAEEPHSEEPSAAELRRDQAALDEQISAVQSQLEELLSHRRAVAAKLSTLENRVQARLSSFRGALAQVEGEVNTFLRARSKQPRNGVGRIKLGDRTQQQTLESAREELAAQNSTVGSQVSNAEAEHQALQEGAVVWNEAVGDIAAFEAALGRELRSLKQRQSNREDENVQKSLAPPDELLTLLDGTIASVQDKLTYAEEKGWNLLVVAIGAELEALSHGRAILFHAVHPTGGGASPAVERRDSREIADDGALIVEDAEVMLPASDWQSRGAAGDNASQDRLASPTPIRSSARAPPPPDDPDPDLLLAE